MRAHRLRPFIVVGLVLLVGTAYAQTPEGSKVISNTVKEARPAELANGDADISSTGESLIKEGRPRPALPNCSLPLEQVPSCPRASGQQHLQTERNNLCLCHELAGSRCKSCPLSSFHPFSSLPPFPPSSPPPPSRPLPSRNPPTNVVLCFITPLLVKAGACTDFIGLYCSKVQRGDSALAECIRDRIEEEETGDANGRKVSKECVKEVDNFFIDRR